MNFFAFFVLRLNRQQTQLMTTSHEHKLRNKSTDLKIIPNEGRIYILKGNLNKNIPSLCCLNPSQKNGNKIASRFPA